MTIEPADDVPTNPVSKLGDFVTAKTTDAEVRQGVLIEISENKGLCKVQGELGLYNCYTEGMTSLPSRNITGSARMHQKRTVAKLIENGAIEKYEPVEK